MHCSKVFKWSNQTACFNFQFTEKWIRIEIKMVLFFDWTKKL